MLLLLRHVARAVDTSASTLFIHARNEERNAAVWLPQDDVPHSLHSLQHPSAKKGASGGVKGAGKLSK